MRTTFSELKVFLLVLGRHQRHKTLLLVRRNCLGLRMMKSSGFCHSLLVMTFILNILVSNTTAFEYDPSTIRSREAFGHMCNERNFTVGAELGVQTGYFSDSFLYTAHSIKKYYLVDTWEQRSNYSDNANVDNAAQEAIYQSTRAKLGPYGNRCVFMRNFTTQAALLIPDHSIDFIYVDARHDYCGVMEDLEAWWPKLRKHGIMAGDDYLTASEQLRMKGNVYNPNDDWAICGNGSRIDGAVKGAVQDFAKRVGVKVHTTWKSDSTNKERSQWPQWLYDPKPSHSFHRKHKPRHNTNNKHNSTTVTELTHNRRRV